MNFTHIGLDEPAEYVIKVQGRLIDDFADWFLGEFHTSFETAESGEVTTILTGTVQDQAALHGLLKHIRDIPLPLLLVDCLTVHNDSNQE